MVERWMLEIQGYGDGDKYGMSPWKVTCGISRK